MTAALADFVTSPEGRFYGAVCARFGVDPGAVFRDDVQAFQMRAAYMSRAAEEAPTEPEPEVPDEWAEFR